MLQQRLKGYFALLLLTGVCWIIVVPPFQAPDEFNHFFRAWQVSEGQWTGVRTPDQRLGGQTPVCLYAITKPYRHLPFNPEGCIAADTILANLQQPFEPAPSQFTDFANTAIYPPTAYLPQAASTLFIRTLHGPPLLMLYVGRLAGFLCWCWMLFQALLLLDDRRRLFAFLAFLPSSLAINTSLSADVVTNGAVFWLLAILLTADKRQPDRASRLLVLGLALLIAVNKTVYTPVLALLWLYPGVWGRRFSWLTVLICLLGIVGWNYSANGLFIPYDQYHPAYRDTQQLNPGVEPVAQLYWMAEHPFAFLKTAITSLLATAPASTIHFIAKFGWEKNYGYLPVVVLLLTALAAVISSEKSNLTMQQRRWLLLTGVAMTLCFTALMYVLWNPVGAGFIHNLGGKYFIPIVPLWACAMANGWLFRWQKAINHLAFIILIVANIILLIQVYLRYFC